MPVAQPLDGALARRDQERGAGGAGGGLVIEHAPLRTRHDGVEVTTAWHVICGGRVLHFTEAEWAAFAAGVRAGEFALLHP